MTYTVLLHLAGAIALLLWAVHMVQTGVDRGWRPELVQALQWSSRPVRAAGVGALLAVALQSSTATGLIAASFAAKGTLTIAAGLALMLGADLGSAIVVAVLSLDLSLLAPVLVTAGALLFFRTDTRRWRQSGRALIGIGLILLSLTLLREATQPLRDSPAIPPIAAYLAGDPLTAMLAGAAAAWLLHSSVAAVVILVTLVTHAVLPFEAAAALLLGANVGGALIPFGLTRNGATAARQIMAGNLLVRSTVALCGLALLYGGLFQIVPVAGDGSRIVALHLALNAAVILFGLPLIAPTLRLARRLVRSTSDEPSAEARLGLPRSVLDPAATDEPATALANATRELIRMAEITARMLEPIMDIYKTGDANKIREARIMEAAVDRAQHDLKLYLARVAFTAKQEEQRGHDLAAIAVNLEHIGDAVCKTLLRLAAARAQRGLAFSPGGWRELSHLHHQVVASMRLAQNVLVTRDLAQARQLVEAKHQVRSVFEQSLRQHMQRLRSGTPASIATSNLHLDTIRTLKTINSLLAGIGYAVLAETDQVLDTRLKPAE